MTRDMVTVQLARQDAAKGVVNRLLVKDTTWIDPAHPYYGADPTGVADSAPAWRSAALAAQSSGAPIIPTPGTYLFASKDATITDVFIPLTSGIRIQPRALGDVTINISNSVTTWATVFGTVYNANVDLSGLEIRNLVVDGDAANNPYPLASTPHRYLVRANKGRGFRFIHNRVVNWDGRNVVSFNGTLYGMSDITVTDNEFDQMGGPLYHDSSVVFILANDYIVAQNKLRGVDLGSTTPNNCIAPFDMHGANWQVVNNYSENFATAGTICGPDPTSPDLTSSGFKVSGNIYKNVGRGFAWFAYTAMDQGEISNNIVDIDMDRWPAVAPVGYNAAADPDIAGFGHPAFVRIQGTLPIPVGEALSNWHITGNTFVWRGVATGLIGDNCYALGNNQTPPSGTDLNIKSVGNVFVNCPSNYLFAYGFSTIQGFVMDDILINPCYAELGANYQSLYRFRSGTAVVNCHLGGTFMDDKAGATSRITRWLLGDAGGGDIATPTFTNVDMDGIRVTVNATTKPAMISTQTSQNIRCSTVVQGWIAPTGNASFTAGSTITEMVTGQTRVQTAIPAGATFMTQLATAPEMLRSISGDTTLAVTVDRSNAAMASAGVGALTSGTCYVGRISIAKPCKPGTVIFVAGTTAAVTPTHRWVALTDANGLVLAVTADATTGAIASNAQVSMNFTTPVDLAPGLYALHLMIEAATVPTVLGISQTTAITGKGTILCGSGATAQTTPPSVGATLAMPASAGVGPVFLQLT